MSTSTPPTLDPPVPASPLWQGALPALLAAAICLLLYVLTVAPGLTWAHDGADGGDLIAACQSGGVPHPGGYPTYCILARPLASLPLGDVARRYNLYSALAAALAVGVTCELVRGTLLRRGLNAGQAGRLALLCSLIWGLGPALWSQAVITEVYALHTLFAALLLWRALTLSSGSPSSAWLVLGMTAGVGLGNHLTLGLLLPGIVLWLWPMWTRWRVLAALGGLALGLCVYLYVPLATRGGAPVAWGNPRDWSGLWWLVSGQLYRRYLFAAPIALLPERLADLARRLLAQFTLPGLALLLLGLETGPRIFPRREMWSGVLVALFPTVYALGYDTADSYVYLLAAFLVGTLWLALGVASAWAALEARPALRRLLPLALFLAAAWLGVVNYRAQDLSKDTEAEQWLATVEAQAPQGALLISRGDAHTFALDCAQWALGERLDLVVVNGELWAYPWYRLQLQRRYPGVDLPRQGTLEALVQARLALQPVYLTARRPELEAIYGLSVYGVLWRVRPTGQ
jgi:hypothetical protein